MSIAQFHPTGLHAGAMFSGLMHAPATLAKRIARRHEFRETFIPLLKERDQILSDIGYQRYDILRALRLPLSEDAMAYVENKRLTRPTDEDHPRLRR